MCGALQLAYNVRINLARTMCGSGKQDGANNRVMEKVKVICGQDKDMAETRARVGAK